MYLDTILQYKRYIDRAARSLFVSRVAGPTDLPWDLNKGGTYDTRQNLHRNHSIVFSHLDGSYSVLCAAFCVTSSSFDLVRHNSTALDASRPLPGSDLWAWSQRARVQAVLGPRIRWILRITFVVWYPPIPALFERLQCNPSLFPSDSVRQVFHLKRNEKLKNTRCR